MSHQRALAARQLLVFCLTIILTSSTRFHQAIDWPKDCSSNEFYQPDSLTCRNCSDLLRYFNRQKEWSDGGESSGDVEFYDRETRLNGKHDDVLSRLISIDTDDDRSSSTNSNDASELDDDGSDDDPIPSLGDNRSSSSESSMSSSQQTMSLVSKFLGSSLVSNELLGAIEQCRRNLNLTACQMWSNICVMSMYSHSDSTSYRTSSDHMSKLRIVPEEKPSGMIKNWQSCRQFDLASVCNGLRDWYKYEKKQSLEMESIFLDDTSDKSINLRSNSAGPQVKLNQVIQFLAYKYSHDGQFMGVHQFGLNDMDGFCPRYFMAANRESVMSLPDNNPLRVGRNMRFRCLFDRVAVSQMIDGSPSNKTIFYELYIGYPQNGATVVRPIPIHIKNLLYNGHQVNRRHSRDPSRWILVRRFFMQSVLRLDDHYRLRRSKTNNVTAESRPKIVKEPGERVLVYAKSATLELRFKRQEKSSQLISFLLTIDYGHVRLVDAATTSNSSKVINQMQANSEILESQLIISQVLVDMSGYKRDLDLTLTILSILSCIWSLVKCYNVQKCFGIVKLDLKTLIMFLLIGCDVVANIVGLVTLFVAGALFISIKLQSNGQLLPPTEELEQAVSSNVKLALVFKLVGLLNKMYAALSLDIFFVDWEKPKMLTTTEIINHHSINQITSKFNGDNLIGASENNQSINDGKSPNDMWFLNVNTLSHQHDQNLGSQLQHSSSFWRPYTIINRWLQLQTQRRVSISIQMITFLCLVTQFQLTDLATSDSSLNFGSSACNGNNGQQACYHHETMISSIGSQTFRIFLLSTLYLIISMGQILYKKCIHEPLFMNRVHEFVDLCSVSNVSLFCMLYPRFGYYIHGRNANGSGDCGIGEINALLEREERDLCSKRGLEPSCDQQTFIMILPKIINDHYRKLLLRDHDLAMNQNQIQSAPTTNSLVDQRLVDSDRLPNKQLGPSTLMAGEAAGGFFRSALGISNQSSNRRYINAMVAKNKAINLFMTNFLEHIYKDLDYSIREPKKLLNLLPSVELDDHSLAASQLQRAPTPGSSSNLHLGGGVSTPMGSLVTSFDKQAAAVFHKDPANSFTSIIWRGMELDLVFVELASLLVIDNWLELPLLVTSSLVWILMKLVERIYMARARNNLISKALIDEKFLFG